MRPLRSVLSGCNLAIFNDRYTNLKKLHKPIDTSIQTLVTNIRNELFEIHIVSMHLKKTYFHEYMIVNDILIEFYKEHILISCMHVIKSTFLRSTDEAHLHSFSI